MVSATGIGSGLDISLIVEQLVQQASRPLHALQYQQSFYKGQLSAYGQLKNALSTFQDKIQDLNSLNAFVKHSATSSDEEILSATTDANATHGQHTVIISNLAQAHQLVSTGFSDCTSSIGVTAGTLTIGINGESFDITVDSTNDSLNSIKNAINNANDNTGVRASLIHVDDGLGGTESRLVLSSDETGAANVITLTDVGGNVAAMLSTTTQTEAKDAVLKVDGYSVTRTSNVINDVLEGISFTLKQGGQTVTLDVARDLEAVKESVQAFVNAYNDFISKMNVYADNELSTDYSMNSIKHKFRSIFNTLIEDVGAYQLLSEIGVHTETIGSKSTDKLSVDMNQLENALNNNFTSVANLFATTDKGIAQRLDDVVADLLGDDGIVKIRQDGLDRRLKSLDTQILRQQTRLDKLEQQYLRQFSALDSMMAQLQATNLYLTQQMSQMQAVSIGK